MSQSANRITPSGDYDLTFTLFLLFWFVFTNDIIIIHSDWSLMFHDDSVEKILIQNESKLHQMWNNIKTGEGCTNVQSMLQLFESYKPKLIIEEASDWAILHTIGMLPSPPTPPPPALNEIPPVTPMELDEEGNPIVKPEGDGVSSDLEPGSKAEGEVEVDRAEGTVEDADAPETKTPVPPPYRAKFTIYPTRQQLREIYFDASVLLSPVDFEGFVESLCKLVASELWRTAEEKSVMAEIDAIKEKKQQEEEKIEKASDDAAIEGGEGEFVQAEMASSEANEGIAPDFASEYPVLPVIGERMEPLKPYRLAEVLNTALKFELF